MRVLGESPSRRLGAVLTLILAGLGACSQEQDTTDAGAATRAAPAQSEREITGSAIVIDGDTIEVAGHRIGLAGIDAPEIGSMCGEVDVYERATAALRDSVGGQDVACVLTSTIGPEGEELGRCAIGRHDLNERMVLLGMAREWPRYSRGQYRMSEREARAYSKGIWSEACPANIWPADRSYSPSDAYSDFEPN